MVWAKIAANILLTFVVIYGLALTGLYLFQRHFLYMPEHFYVVPGEVDPALKEFPVTTADGLNLIGWYAPVAGKPYTIVFFHGNADNLRTVAGVAQPYRAVGYGVLLAEYRGYSGLPGSPTEDGLYDDARAYMKALIAFGVPVKNIILFGHSLGSGVAVQMANEFDVGGLMLMSPYLSMAMIAQLHYPMFPAERLTRDRYESFRKIGNIKCPLLIGHGDQDRVIPFSQGKELFDLAHEPKIFRAFPGGGHNDLWSAGYFEASTDWLKQLAGP